jgi:integrase/recombinase XerC
MDKIYLIETFIDYLIAKDRSPATIKSYTSDLYLFAKWFEEKNHEELKAKKITPTDLRQYKQHLIDHPMKPSSINRKIGVLKTFVNWLLDTDRIQQRFPLPKMVKETNTTPRLLDKNHQNAMLRHLEKYASDRDYAIICYATNIMLHPRGVCDIYFAPVLRHLY